MEFYKTEESLYIPNNIKLFIDSSVDDVDKETAYNAFLSSLETFQNLSNRSLNLEEIHEIFDSFLNFIYYFPDNIKEYFQNDLCLAIQSYINENLITWKNATIIKDAMNIIAYICYFDKNYIQFFSDNGIIDVVIRTFLPSTHELFASIIFLFDALLLSNTSQQISKICDYAFPPANDYCLALQRGIDKEGENIRIATSFFYSLATYLPNLDHEKTLRIIDVVKFQIEWNENQSPIPNDIFVFTLWTYKSLLQNFLKYAKLFVTDQMISIICRLLEDNFDRQVHGYIENVEKNPLRPLLAIFQLFYTSHSNFEGLFQVLVDKTPFSRLIELAKSDNSVIALESFGVLKAIIIHHHDLIHCLIEFDLIPCLNETFEKSYSLKTEAYSCVINLLLCEIPDLVFNILADQIFLLSVEYISMTSENERKVFLLNFLRVLKYIISNFDPEKMLVSFSQNGIFELLEQIYEDQPENLVNEVKSLLTPKE